MQPVSELMAFSEPEWHDCPACGTDSMRPGLCWDCSRVERARSDAREAVALAKRNLPPAFADMVLGPAIAARVRPVERLSDAERVLALEPHAIAFTGPPGAGKTTLAVAMLKAWMDRRVLPAMFVESFRLCGGAMHLDPDMVTVPLLLLDDMGAEREMASTLIPELIYQRHARSLPTWVTTGIHHEHFAARYGGGIARRVFERATILRMGTP